MVAGGEALRRDVTFEDGVFVTRQPAERRGEQALHLDVGAKLLRGTDIEVGVAAQGVGVFLALRHETQHGARSMTAQVLAQASAVAAHEHVVGAQGEDAGKRGQIDVLAEGGEHGLRLFNHVPDLLAKFQRPRRGRKPPAGAHQHGVAHGVADAGKAAAHGRRAEIEPARRADDAAFLDQHVQRQQQVEV
ncbi:hypothetical protein D3C87_1573000 [compost metagenome]